VLSAFLSGLIPHDFAARSAPIDMTQASALPPEYLPFVKGYDLLSDGSLLAVELPGHAAGQMGIFARDDNDQVFFFVADAAWLARAVSENLPPHPLADLLFADSTAYRATLSRLHTYRANHPDVLVIPSHCAETLARTAAK
jgi:glyoxylase-like metal-dependent hydrolase (beta-lactamase superfamily II)